MKRSCIKDSFGGEVAFTKFIAEDLETSRRLLGALDLSDEDGYTITPEEHTTHLKRVDLVVRDQEGEIFLVIESQDATGWLDSVHASKIAYYMYDKRCDDGVLLCEDADEHVKGFVKWFNENTPLRITLISVLVFELKDHKYCEFVPLIRPSNLDDKKVVSKVAVNTEAQQARSEQIKAIYDSNPGMFTHVTRNYVSRNNVKNLGLNVAVSQPYKNGGHFVEIWHAGKHNTKEFRDTFTKICESAGLVARFQNRRGYVNEIDGGPILINDAIKFSQLFIDNIENSNIQV